MIYFVNQWNLILWFTLILEILGNMGIIITYSQILKSEMLKLTLVFLSGCFLLWPTNSGKKMNILRTKWDFNRKYKEVFILFIKANRSNFFGRRASDFKQLERLISFFEKKLFCLLDIYVSCWIASRVCYLWQSLNLQLKYLYGAYQ